MPTDQQRFWLRVNKNGPLPVLYPHLGPCWLWTAGKESWGYGVFKIAGVQYRAHRLAYTWTYGPIAPKLFICHHCDTPACVRPTHLFPGTILSNNQDAHAKRRNYIGSLNGNAKVTEALVIEIRTLFPAQGITAIARQFNISKHLVFDIVHRRSWKHIPEMK